MSLCSVLSQDQECGNKEEKSISTHQLLPTFPFTLCHRWPLRRILVGMDERIKRVVRDSLVMFITRVHCLPLTNVVYQMQLTQEGTLWTALQWNGVASRSLLFSSSVLAGFRECCLDIYHSAGVAGSFGPFSLSRLLQQLTSLLVYGVCVM